MQSQTSVGLPDRGPWSVRRRGRRLLVGVLFGVPPMLMLACLLTRDTTEQVSVKAGSPCKAVAASTASSFDADGRIVAFWSVASDRGARGSTGGDRFVRSGPSPAASGPAHAVGEVPVGEPSLE